MRAQFARAAHAAVADIEARGKRPILCGGTGLYFNAFFGGVGAAPAAEAELRLALENTPLEELLRELSADAEILEETHEQWLKYAEAAERDLKRNGLFVRRVPIDVESLSKWCSLQKRPLNGAARAEYTIESNRLMK